MADSAGDPLRTMVIDAVLRDDGRYLVYYGWPDGTDAVAARTEDAQDEREPATDDV